MKESSLREGTSFLFRNCGFAQLSFVYVWFLMGLEAGYPAFFSDFLCSRPFVSRSGDDSTRLFIVDPRVPPRKYRTYDRSCIFTVAYLFFSPYRRFPINFFLSVRIVVFCSFSLWGWGAREMLCPFSRWSFVAAG